MRTIKLNRGREWLLSDLDSATEDGRVERIWENPKAKKIVELNLDQVEPLPLVEEVCASPDWTQVSFNKSLDDKLRDYQEKGYILLDGAVVVALLQKEELVPALWSRITDSDSYNRDSAIIRFDGSVYRLKNYENVDLILTPFSTRGHFGYGFGKKYPNLPALTERPQSPLSKELTVAIRG